jgi:iron-sulfur cluster assembly accessory protein
MKMSVETFDPGGSILTVTPAARAHLESQARHNGSGAIRVGIRESGCNGYMYTLDYIGEPASDDEAVAVDGAFRLYVSRQDLPLVRGTIVDFVREGLNASIRFKNPNAESHCGCGESFALRSAAG